MSDPPPPIPRRDTLMDAEALAPTPPQPPSNSALAGEPPSAEDDPDTLVSRAPDATGTFQRTPLVYVLVHVLDRRFTGMLVVRTEAGTTALLTLREGAIVRVETHGEGDRLGEEAVAAGACTHAQVESALAISQGEGTLLGNELVAQASMSREMVSRLMLTQTAKRVAALVNLPPETTYALHLGDRDAAPHEPWAPLDVLLAAVRAWGDRPRIHGTIRFVGARPLRLHPEADLRGLMALPAERTAILAMSRGGASLETLYRSIGGGLSSLVYVLAVTRQLILDDDDRPPMGRPPEGLRQEVDAVAPTPNAGGPPDSPPVIVIAPLQQPVTESFVRADTLPEIIPVGVPRRTAPYPSAPPPPVAAPPLPKTTLVSATAPPRASSAPTPASVPAVPQPTVRSSPAPPPTRPPLPPTPPAPVPSRAAAVAKQPPPPPAQKVDEVTAAFEAAEAALARHDLKAAETCAVQATRLAPKRPDVAALFAWVGAHSGDEDAVPESVRALTRILEEHPKCEPALYYRGMLLKRAGKDKAALRDFVMILYENPSHVNALNEVRELRKKKK